MTARILPLWVLVFFISLNLNAQDQEKPVVAMLGVFHFAGSNDLLSVKFDDLRSDKRQAEILEAVEKLKAFKPTKVILEFPYGNNKLDSVYQLYRKGERKLSINERQQLGFRVAADLGHEYIYPADKPSDLPFNELMGFLQQEGRMQEFQQLIEQVKTDVILKDEEFLKENSVMDYLVKLNDEQHDRDNKRFYIQYALGYNSDDNDIGVRLVTAWWERNFRIMANIDRIAEPGDRILVIFGQGHTAIMKDYYKGRDDMVYEEITDYMK